MRTHGNHDQVGQPPVGHGGFCPGRRTGAVREKGAGAVSIPKENLVRLFSPFDRLGAEQSAVEGTGLGLALSKRLVEAMGGFPGVETVVGEGSTFWIELTVVSGPGESAAQTGLCSSMTEVSPLAARQTVLYIEDNLSNLKLVSQILVRRPGIKLISAMQGGLGVDLAREHAPSLILLDVNLPDMDGGQVLAQLGKDPRTAAIPVVVVSADAMHGQVERLLSIGARAYVTKPIDVQKFLGVLNQVLPETPGPGKVQENTPWPVAA